MNEKRGKKFKRNNNESILSAGNRFQRWTIQQSELLLKLNAEKVSHPEIARLLGRTISAIRHEINRQKEKRNVQD